MSDPNQPPPEQPPSGRPAPEMPGAWAPPPSPPPPTQGYGAPQPPSPYQQIGVPFASWGQRAIAYLWDWVYLWPGWVTAVVGYIIVGIGAANDSGALVGVGFPVVLVGFGLMIWRLVINYMLDQGRTGYTYGKRKGGIRTVRTADLQPSGVGSCVGRWFLHWLINQACYIDYLWPLWDPMRQTLTDKILDTYVIVQPDTGR